VLNDRAVARIVKQVFGRTFSGHSLRASCITSALVRHVDPLVHGK
jgi:hypothetical protein